jgi:exopolysaccharide biosynthesis polyprenyl glycosylphosphotransferase
VGMNSRGLETAAQIEEHGNLGYDIIGFVQAIDDKNPKNIENGIPLLGKESQLKEIILNNQVSDVVLALEKLEHNRMMEVITQVNGSPVSIKIVPDMYEVISGLARTEQIYGIPLIQVNPNLNTLYNRYSKRVLDLLIAIPSFILISPFWGIISILIKLDSTGPVLYKQDRIGENHRKFTIRKFRSMKYDAEMKTGPIWATDSDPRITRVGGWLRRFRLDEIPQLLNVIKGEMSIIGPRPERPYFMEQLMQEFPFYYRRHKIRPGITGWAQIKQPYDRDINDVRKKLKYDFYYIENLSFSLDMKILASTAWVMLSGKGR